MCLSLSVLSVGKHVCECACVLCQCLHVPCMYVVSGVWCGACVVCMWGLCVVRAAHMHDTVVAPNIIRYAVSHTRLLVWGA